MNVVGTKTGGEEEGVENYFTCGFLYNIYWNY